MLLTSGNTLKTIEERTIENFVFLLSVSLYYFSFGISFYTSTLTSKYFRDIFYKRLKYYYQYLYRTRVE